MTVDLRHEYIGDVTIAPMAGHFAYSASNPYEVSKSPSFKGNFQTAVGTPSEIAEANGLNIQPQAVTNEINTGFDAGLAYQAENVGLNLQSGGSIFSDLFNQGMDAVSNALTAETTQVQLQIMPPPSLDVPSPAVTPPTYAMRPGAGGFGA